MPTWLRSVLLAFICLGVLVRCVLCLRDLGVIDNLFIPDDTYYTLSIARSIANGDGASVDGRTITNGFQPLTALLLVPWFLISTDPDAGLRAGIVLSAVADIGSIVLIGIFCAKAVGTFAGLFASSLWSVSRFVIANALNGLETSLAVCMVLIGTVLWQNVVRNPDSRLRYALGVAWALALLARIDTAFVIVVFGLSCIFQKQFRLLVPATVVGLLCLAPWWIYQMIHFGTIIPESGAAVREIVRVHQALYLDVSHQIAWSAGTIIGPPMLVSPLLRSFLSDHAAIGIMSVAGYIAVLGFLSWWSTRRMDPANLLPVLSLIAWGVVVMIFYTFYLPALWFFSRYLLPVVLSSTCVLALAIGKWSKQIVPGTNMALLGGSVTIVLLAASAQSVMLCLVSPSGSIDGGLAGAKGYRRVAHDVIAAVPEGAVVGSLQSGAIGYYGKGKIRTVNLDGVIDAEAAEAFRDGTLGRFARSRGVTHFADWPFNYNVLNAKGGPEIREAHLRRIGWAAVQANESMRISVIEW